MLWYICRDVYSARELDGYFLIQIVKSAVRSSLHPELPCGVPGVGCEKVVSRVSKATTRGELSYLAPLGSEIISTPYFKQCFFGGGITPQTVKHHASQSQDINNKYFILYIEFVAADLLFRLARMRHAWKGDCCLTVLVFSWQILFLLS